MIVVSVKDLNRIMEQKRRIWESLSGLRSSSQAKTLRLQCLGTKKESLGALNTCRKPNSRGQSTQALYRGKLGIETQFWLFSNPQLINSQKKKKEKKREGRRQLYDEEEDSFKIGVQLQIRQTVLFFPEFLMLNLIVIMFFIPINKCSQT